MTFEKMLEYMFGRGYGTVNAQTVRTEEDMDRLLQKAGSQLARKERELEQRERGLAFREKNCCAREKTIRASWAKLDRERTDLEEWSIRLKGQEHERKAAQAEYERKAKALEVHERSLESRESTLREGESRYLENLNRSAERYAAERKLWQEARPGVEEASPMKEEMARTRQKLTEAKDAFLAAQDSFRTLMQEAGENDREGVAALCALYRDMALSGQESAVRLAHQLGAILCMHFDAEPLEPEAGDPYDRACHERVDAARRGDRVSCCLARGWRRYGETLLRAVVDTEDKEG